MTVQGEDLLAWLDAAIGLREEKARRLGGKPFEVKDYGGGLVLFEGVELHEDEIAHIMLHDPASVLRRCAADRKLLALHDTPGNVFPDGAYLDDNRWCVGCGYGNDAEPLTPDVNDCPTLVALAEGYGWTGDER